MRLIIYHTVLIKIKSKKVDTLLTRFTAGLTGIFLLRLRERTFGQQKEYNVYSESRAGGRTALKAIEYF